MMLFHKHCRSSQVSRSCSWPCGNDSRNGCSLRNIHTCDPSGCQSPGCFWRCVRAIHQRGVSFEGVHWTAGQHEARFYTLGSRWSVQEQRSCPVAVEPREVLSSDPRPDWCGTVRTSLELSASWIESRWNASQRLSSDRSAATLCLRSSTLGLLDETFARHLVTGWSLPFRERTWWICDRTFRSSRRCWYRGPANLKQ